MCALRRVPFRACPTLCPTSRRAFRTFTQCKRPAVAKLVASQVDVRQRRVGGQGVDQFEHIVLQRAVDQRQVGQVRLLRQEPGQLLQDAQPDQPTQVSAHGTLGPRGRRWRTLMASARKRVRTLNVLSSLSWRSPSDI